MDFKSKPIIIVSAVIVVILVLAAGFWYWSNSKQATPSEEATSLGGQIFDRTQSPLEGQVPDTNPFKDQKNPLDTIYKNPFE